METLVYLLGAFLLIALAFLPRVLAGSMDGERVERYLRERGFELVDRSWDPFGPGWFGETKDRIYQIVYRDDCGNLHMAHVKTSMWSGVYLTNDKVVRHALDHGGKAILGERKRAAKATYP